MNLIAKRKAKTLAKDSSLLQNSVDYFQRLDIGTAQIKDAAITTAKINDLAVTTAKIENLAVTDAKINTLAVSKLTAGTMTADVTIANTFKTAASPNQRIEITSSMIAGYSDATTKQFYLQASDGKAYCAAGGIVFDSLGMAMKGSVAQIGIYGTTTPTVAVGYISNGGGDNTLTISTNNADGRVSIYAKKYVTITAELEISLNSELVTLPNSTSAVTSESDLRYDSTNHLIKYHNGTAEKTIATTSTTQQTQADFTPDRAIDTIYRNTSGKTMVVHAAGFRNNSVTLTAYSDSNSTPAIVVAQSADYSTGETCTTGVTWIVPNNYYYKVTPGISGFTLSYWTEWVIG